MAPEIVYVVSESLKSVVQAAGITGRGDAIPVCPLQVGDVISEPSAPGLFLRVTSRWYSAGSADKPERWLLTLEQAADPIAHLDTQP